MAEIKLSGINKIYPGGTHAVHDVDLHIADGEFMIMVGPSGCAKSTILRMIAGLEVPTSGTVEIGGRVVNDVAPKDRDIAMVFQSYALYPHMTVRQNMAFGLKLRKMPESHINERVSDAARILGLEHLLDRLPKQMSGGQRQRVAMGRAIVREPQAFLMDEPLSNLDAKLRVQMRAEIAKLHNRLQTTTVYVTHDQVEALTLGQRICILRLGVVQQVDTPYMVYNNPSNVFVAGFIGSPAMNFVLGTAAHHNGVPYLDIGGVAVPLPESVMRRLLVDPSGRQVIVGFRPEHVTPVAPGTPGALGGHIDLVESMGSESYAYFTTQAAAPDLTSLSDTQSGATGGVARVQGSNVHAGPVGLMVDPSRLQLFDPSSLQTMLAPIYEHELTDEPHDLGHLVAQTAALAHEPAREVYIPQPSVAVNAHESLNAETVLPPRPTFGAPPAVRPVSGVPAASTNRSSALFNAPNLFQDAPSFSGRDPKGQDHQSA